MNRTNEIKRELEIAGRFPLLTREQEILYARIIQKWQNGEGSEKAGLRAREKLINHNLRLVIYIAKTFVRKGSTHPFPDLIQEGTLGLARAAEKFDPKRGVRFSTYATRWVSQSIRRSCEDRGDTIRIPSHVQAKIIKTQYIKTVLESRGIKPTASAIAQYLMENEAKLKWVKRAKGNTEKLTKQVSAALKAAKNKQIVSLDIPVGKESDNRLVDIYPDHNGIDLYDSACQREMQHLARKLIENSAVLNRKEQLVLYHRMGFDGKPLAHEQIGKILNRSRQTSLNIETAALRKLRKRFKGDSNLKELISA